MEYGENTKEIYGNLDKGVIGEIYEEVPGGEIG